MKPKIGRQTPTTSIIIPYKDTKGEDAIKIYNSTTRKAREWQEFLTYDILATNEDGLWVHSKFGYEVPRRNGKGEIIVIRELYGLTKGEHILHTAHRTTTSHSAWERLCELLDEARIEYTATKQFGLETIRLENGGICNFRTRSSKGGLGEGYDLLIIDEAQEYTVDQESALKYVVTDSANPQTLFCGTPPTAVSSGTVFMKLRDKVLVGASKNTGWAEWSIEFQSNPNDKKLWYETNPSLGLGLSERNIEDEITGDDVDFNIQRLGLWIRYNQASAISEKEWGRLKVDTLPTLVSEMCVGIKYGHDNLNVAMSVAVKTSKNQIFVETIDCRKVKEGNDWIIDFLKKTKCKNVVVDGAGAQDVLAAEMKEAKLKAPILPKVKDVIVANSIFEQEIANETICHNDQPSLTKVVTNCEHRAIGSNGGFGYRSIVDKAEVALLDSVILANWKCSQIKRVRKKQKISY